MWKRSILDLSWQLEDVDMLPKDLMKLDELQQNFALWENGLVLKFPNLT